LRVRKAFHGTLEDTTSEAVPGGLRSACRRWSNPDPRCRAVRGRV